MRSSLPDFPWDALAPYADAVCLFQDLLHPGMIVLDFCLTGLPGDEFRDELHGARTVYGDEGDDVLYFSDAEFLAEILHA